MEKIAASPRKLGLNGIISVSIEKNLFHDEKLIAQPDVTIELIGGRVCIIEYKNNGNGEERATKQLATAKWWYGRYRKDLRPEDIEIKIISGTDPQYRDLLG